MYIPKNEELVEFLRLLADFYEEHPDVPAPMDLTYGFLGVYLPDSKAKEILAGLGSFEKVIQNGDYGDYFIAKKKLGCMTLNFKVRRESVCTPKVVGKRTIPAHIVPAKFEPEQIVPEREEDIIEWECAPILANRQEAEELEVKFAEA